MRWNFPVRIKLDRAIGFLRCFTQLGSLQLLQQLPLLSNDAIKGDPAGEIPLPIRLGRGLGLCEVRQLRTDER